MENEFIDLSHKEVRRLQKIASGNSASQHTSEETTLLRYGLIKKGNLVVFTDGQPPRVNLDSLVITQQGKEYLVTYAKMQRTACKESFRFWFPTIIAILSLIVSIIAIL